MLRVEVDIFSGRPNPTWIVTNPTITRRVLTAVRQDRTIASKPGTGFQGLGFRGVLVQILGDDDDAAIKARLPEEFVLGNGRPAARKKSAGVVTALIEDMNNWAHVVLPEHSLTPVDKEMRDLILPDVNEALRKPPGPPTRQGPSASPIRQTIRDAQCRTCQYEISRFNPAFWNSNAYVQRWNNCYNYGRNWKTNTFAQPGRASGAQTSVMSCPTVAAAARSDGLVDRCRCLPPSEYPRRLMALVIAPGRDYHWYRHQIGGFWGHKPGPTAARNTDNSNAVITDPATCNRGIYTDFCGYFYAGKSVVIA